MFLAIGKPVSEIDDGYKEIWEVLSIYTSIKACTTLDIYQITTLKTKIMIKAFLLIIFRISQLLQNKQHFIFSCPILFHPRCGTLLSNPRG